ncbi:group II intron maturase-specific domain-containing protein [Enterococcus hirae]
MRQLTKRNKSISLDERIVKLKQVIYGWANYFRKAKMKRKLAEIDAKLRSRIRVIIWKQWKNYRKRICSLVQLGIPEEENLLSKRLSICWIIESDSKSPIQ